MREDEGPPLTDQKTSIKLRKELSSVPNVKAAIWKIFFDIYAERPCIGGRSEESAHFSFHSYRRFGQKSLCFAVGLLDWLNLANPKEVLAALIFPNSVEFYTADFGCAFASIVSVPIYETLGPQQIVEILEQAEIPLLIIDTKTMKSIIPYCKKLPKFVVLAQIHHSHHSVAEIQTKNSIMQQSYLKVIDFNQLIQAGEKLIHSKSSFSLADLPASMPTDLFTLFYTSGSTGTPKGAMISEGAWFYRNYKSVFPEMHPLVWLSFQPPAHLMDRRMVWHTITCGGIVGIASLDKSKLFDDFAALRPTRVASTPAFWNSLVVRYNQEIENGVTSNVAKQNIVKLLGNRVKAINVGAAPVGEQTIAFLEDCFKCKVRDTYGSSESDTVSGNGKLAPGTEYILLDVPELGYTSSDKPNPRGELCLKTPGMFFGYYKDEKSTKDSIHNGYYRTGDIAEKDSVTGTLKFIDRKKNVMKLAHGEYVTFERLEIAYSSSKYCRAVFVYAKPLWPFVGAVVVPSDIFYQKILGRPPQSDEERGSICKDHVAISKMKIELAKIASKNHFTNAEIPRIVLLRSEPFTVQNGCLISSGKMARAFLNRQYEVILQEMLDNQKSLSEQTIHQAAQSPTASVRDVINSIVLKCVGESLNLDGLSISGEQSPSLRDIGCDSLAAARISSSLRSRWQHLKISAATLLAPSTTLDKLVLAASDPSISIEQDSDLTIQRMIRDCELPADIIPLPFDDKTATNKGDVLLTGATGFLGLHLLVEVLKSFSGDIYCIIRAASRSQAQSRMNSLLIDAGLEEIWDRYQKRIKIIVGDISTPNFGLNTEEYDRIANSVTRIYHCAAQVNHILSYEELYEANVLGTLHILRLCCAGVAKQLHFISSIGVISKEMRQNTEKILETTGDISREAFRYLSMQPIAVGYAQSKRVAEHLVVLAAERGLVASITRPSFIAPHSITGHCNIEDTPCRLLRSLCETGLAPNTDEMVIDLSPVDYVCLGIVAASKKLRSSDSPSIWHSIHPKNLVPIDTLIQACREHRYKISKIDFEEWQRILTETPNSFQPLAPRFPPTGHVYSKLIDRQKFYAAISDVLLPPSLQDPYSQNSHVLYNSVLFLQRKQLIPLPNNGKM